jgi:NADH:ubiquinone oxidoreductase subunit C
LPRLLNEIATETTENPGNYATLKTNCEDINRIMTQILQVLDKIKTERASKVSQYYTDVSTGDISEQNTEISTIKEELRLQMKALQSENLDTDLKAAMVDYTTEKNSASRNMMAIYGFLNIVAVGMLVYLYRSSK